jgi:UDP-N-acetylglucosamine--N-acetylmuramyl-(pentapeptide) pyrophosphoryl-undecaprenol N-acetylglucosamine transferase
MKIVITGAGGGHFYPLIAVVEQLRRESFTQSVAQPEVFFLSDKPYDEKALFDNQIKFIPVPAGKLRLYPSLETLGDIFKTTWGCIVAFFKLYAIYPDVVFAKGGYASFPTLFAARILSIPVVVHESDTVPGRTTVWAGKFASRIALSYPEASYAYNESLIALTGQPIREHILPAEGYEKHGITNSRPLILILGGSQGSVKLNNAVIQHLPEILHSYDVVHQAGTLNVEELKASTKELLKDHPFKDHYFVDGFIDTGLFYPKTDLAITRAGSSMFELALWQIPMIVVPIPETISRDQRSNAYAMLKKGVAVVLEENNLDKTIFFTELSHILRDSATYEQMSLAGKQFESSRTAARVIATELMRIALSHQ